MSSKFAWTIGAALLTLVNLCTLAANLSIKARADVAGMDYNDLKQDSDFKRAVEDIAEDTIEDCKVDGDEIKC